MGVNTSAIIKRLDKKDLAACENINELVYSYTDFAKNDNLVVDDLLNLIRDYKARRSDFEKAGDKYTRATKPAFRR